MEVFAGGVSDSDRVFKGLTGAVEGVLGDTSAPASLRHEVLQMTVTFVCGISQLSPGAYFLQHDLFPCIAATITAPDTGQFTFEAVLLMALLANFHKSDAAKMNPYLTRIRDSTDEALMRKICWAANFAVAAVVKAYQSIQDDSPPTLTTSFGSMFSALRPDRVLASKPVDLPREVFKSQPIEACVILLPLFEFLHGSATFRKTFTETLITQDGTSTKALPLTFLSMTSYLLSHASSSSSPRAIAYANLALNILLVISESEEILGALSQNTQLDIRLCRQRPPYLPPFDPPRSPLCAFLDCCILWLRHNMQKKLEVQCYLTCIGACYRILWYLQKEHVRLDYHWQELWRALVLLLDFLASKLESLTTTGGIEQLVQETLLLVDFALCRSEQLLPSPAAVNELVYEVVRSAEVFRKQHALLEKLANPHSNTSPKRVSGSKPRAKQALENIIALAEQFEAKLREAGVRSANQGLRAVAKDIEKSDGLSYGVDLHGADDPP
ncbi:uncharacterized protein TRAVEDRAFT_33082 [Trametes versicolor FP-101664 SS1]|uniref:uncharacterized protein n=1 Tax=Trametes versicolor (strain FP-101664) TaxID=717944 RepID=UPI00046220E5|nr:uncharacterized protein TRAVEDRAFT_33082 [Trametes versicolor FP-101664 SS1]EIW64282.1 hypothetical protein TRAVEDRAFT_33082 [Trametes versicolor FP-101664 SS1]